jgi:amino acid transporter
VITIEKQKMKIDWEKIKNIFKNEEFYIVLFFIGAFGLIAWFKGGGDSDWFFAIFFGLIILVVVVILAGVVAMFVRDYLDEKQTKIKNSYAKFFITRLTWVGLIILVFFIYIKVF